MAVVAVSNDLGNNGGSRWQTTTGNNVGDDVSNDVGNGDDGGDVLSSGRNGTVEQAKR